MIGIVAAGTVGPLSGIGIPGGSRATAGPGGTISPTIGDDQLAQMYAAARGRGDPDAMRLAVAGWRAFWDERADDAESCFRDALELSPGQGLALLGLGVTCWWTDDLDEAARLVGPVATDGWSGCRAWAILGLIARERGDDAEAERCYRRALAIDPSWHPAHRGLALVYLRRGELRRGFGKHEHRERTFARPWITTPICCNSLGGSSSGRATWRGSAEPSNPIVQQRAPVSAGARHRPDKERRP